MKSSADLASLSLKGSYPASARERISSLATALRHVNMNGFMLI